MKFIIVDNRTGKHRSFNANSFFFGVALAGLISAHSPLAVQGAKHVLNAAARAVTREGLDYVALWNSAFLHSDDLEEAVRSFAERRQPRFTGR